MHHVKHNLLALLKDESATVVIEYGLIATVISIIALSSMTLVGGSVNGFFGSAVAAFR